MYTFSVHRFLPLAALFFLTLAPVVHAEQIDMWDFTVGQHMPDGSQELSVVERVPEGLHVQTSTNGFLIWQTPLVHPVDVLTLKIRSAHQVTAGFLWHPKEDRFIQLQRDFTIPQSSEWHNAHLTTSTWPDWNWQTDEIGIGFPAGTDLVIESMTWRRYSLAEKLATAWQSFWTFDDFRVYSINFLWGPLLATNPIVLADMYDYLPPTPWSVTRIFYALIGLSALIGAIFFAFDRQGGKRIFLLLIACTTVASWLVFDLRMGVELMDYAFNDYQTYVQPADEDKTFRTHGSFYTVAQKMLPTIRQYDRYVLHIDNSSPFYANMRYITYPSLALRPDENTDGVKLHVMIERKDIRVVDGRLVDRNNEVLSGSGQILETIEPGSFLFTTP